MKDVGKPKAEVAAERVMQRVKGVTVVPHFCRIEEKDVSFYQDFQIIVLGLDSLEARSYINSVVCGFLGANSYLNNLIGRPYISQSCRRSLSFHFCNALYDSLSSSFVCIIELSYTNEGLCAQYILFLSLIFSSICVDGIGECAEYEDDGSPNIATIKPLVDGGTEGFKGHARVIFPGITPCFHCSLWLFPPQVTFPLCTLAETPRSPAHCIEYAHLIQWGQVRSTLSLLIVIRFQYDHEHSS